MKKNIKTIVIVVILLLVGVLAAVGVRTAKTYLSGASSGEEPKNVRVQADVKSATVNWQSDKESQCTIEYGTTPASLLLRALENQASTSHRVVLSPLKEATTYYFRVRCGDNTYDNNGIPFSFKTKQGEGTSGSGAGGDQGQSSAGQTPTAAANKPTDVPPANPTKVVSSPPPAGDGKVPSCVKSEFKDKFGTSDSQYDFDDNGTVNSKDWIKCLNQNE